jgi:large subunit ribosomal protein L10
MASPAGSAGEGDFRGGKCQQPDRLLEAVGLERREQVDRAQKAEFVTNLNQVFANAGVVVVSQNLGLTVAQSNELRRRMGEAGATVKVAKNRLAKLALEGTDAKDIAGLFSGPTMIAHSSDPVVAPKIIAEFAKQHAKFVILGAALGRTVLDADGVRRWPNCRRSTSCGPSWSA